MNEIIDFPKIECPFVRKQIGDRYLITPEINKGYEWVFEDKGVKAVDKIDGTNICIEIKNGNINRVFNRTTEKFIFNIHQTKWEGAAMEGISHSIQRDWLKNLSDRIYYGELIGKMFNTNRHKLECHLFVPFDYLKDKCHWHSWIQDKYPKDFDTISEWFKEMPSLFNQRLKLPEIKAEGLIFYHPDGRMAKIRSDMFSWYTEKGHKE